MRCLYQHENWPHWVWQADRLVPYLSKVRYEQGRLLGKMQGLDDPFQSQATLRALTEETVNTSAIEGERLDLEAVRSSLARKMGVPGEERKPTDRHIDGITEMMLDATQNFASPLTEKRVLGWHAALFPTGRSGLYEIAAGKWRRGKVEVVSGALGRETTHFEAPGPELVEPEMRRFFAWFMADAESTEPLLKAGLAHLYFVTIHPFEDGNGRIARAITEMSLARSEMSAQRFYSMSSQILEDRKEYYRILESTQKNGIDVTEWLIWFLECLARAISKANRLTAEVLAKEAFWRSVKQRGIAINERQQKMINLLIDGFQGKLTTEKWAKLSRVSHDTALRDIHDLIAKGVLRQEAPGGRSTSYALVTKAEMV